MQKPIYRLGSLPLPDGGEMLFRHNDGSLVIMTGAADDENTRPVLTVPRVHEVSRKVAYSAPDADQEAFARRVVELLNLAGDEKLVPITFAADGVGFVRESMAGKIAETANNTPYLYSMGAELVGPGRPVDVGPGAPRAR